MSTTFRVLLCLNILIFCCTSLCDQSEALSKFTQANPIHSFSMDEVTLVHSFIYKSDLWVERFYSEYVTKGEPPSSWWNFVPIWTRPQTKIKIRNIQYESIQKKSYLSNLHSSDTRYLPGIFIANPKPGIEWYDLSLSNKEKNQRVWQKWNENFGDLPNEFSGEKIYHLEIHGWPLHSEFYRQYKIIGASLKRAGLEEDYYHAIVLHPEVGDVLEESTLLFPKNSKYLNDDSSLNPRRIYSKIFTSKCRKALESNKN